MVVAYKSDFQHFGVKITAEAIDTVFTVACSFSLNIKKIGPFGIDTVIQYSMLLVNNRTLSQNKEYRTSIVYTSANL